MSSMASLRRRVTNSYESWRGFASSGPPARDEAEDMEDEKGCSVASELRGRPAVRALGENEEEAEEDGEEEATPDEAGTSNILLKSHRMWTLRNVSWSLLCS